MMQKITWKCLCYFCQRPIQGGRPTILFATDKAMMLGICHSTCGYSRFQHGHFQMRPPAYLPDEQLSFLVQFFYSLYSLPGSQEPNRELRMCLVDLLRDYPTSMVNPMAVFRKFLADHKRFYHEWLYEGDLETDFIRILGHIQRAARESPIGAEIDFRT